VFSFVPRCHGLWGRRSRPEPGVDPQAGVLRHLGSLIPGQGPTELRGQRGDRARNGVADRLGAMPGERGPVLHANAGVMARHARQLYT
jgi:hypothetical protein